jgi:hypothetical protein
MITTKQAQKLLEERGITVSYSTIAQWTRSGRFKGAECRETERGPVWYIPIDSVMDYQPPDPGRPYSGVQATISELMNRGHTVVRTPANHPGDLSCISPNGANFVIEVKTSKSSNTQIAIPVRYLHAECKENLFFVVIKLSPDGKSPLEYFVLTDREIKEASALMPKFRTSGEPYVIRSIGYIDWVYVTPHHERWDKLPQ